jgi:hypothetical protein
MAEEWFYVIKGSRKGPVLVGEIIDLLASNEIGTDDFVWKKGFDTWKRIKEVDELSHPVSIPNISLPHEDFPPVVEKKIYKLLDLPRDGKKIYIRIGQDRGTKPIEYGPYDFNVLKKLHLEKRINGKTEIISNEMSEWIYLADFSDYETFFGEVPPPILEEERREATRKPFKARLFIQNNKKVFEGVCRDISVGGMQVLIEDFPGKAGDKISINVHPDNSDYHFVAAGSIVRMLQGNQGFSFRFHHLTEEAKNAIEKYINEHSSK